MQLTLEHVRKAYGETVALGRREGERTRPSDVDDGVTFDVEDGEFFTLVGPSGCGKTTTLRLVAGFDSPTAGAIRFDGKAMSGVPPEDRDVGVVFQNYALFPHLSVAENVAYGLKFADPPDGTTRDERVTSLLELVDLPDAGDRDPDELSGGQQQRVALARALAPGPDLLLLDEPMSALDARLRERLRMQIKEIQSTLGITTLYVTHDQEEALAISDRVAVMNDGRIEQIGTPQNVYRRPESRFVAEFVGDNNVFEGTVVDVRDPNTEKRPRSPSVSGGSPVETKGLSGDDGSEGIDDRGTESNIERRLVVDVGGAEIHIETSAPVSEGEHVVCCIRPEMIRVRGVEDRTAVEETGVEESTAMSGESTPITNVLTATVSESEFLGDSTRTHLRWNDRQLTVRTDDPISGTVQVEFADADVHVVDVTERRRR